MKRLGFSCKFNRGLSFESVVVAEVQNIVLQLITAVIPGGY